MTFCLGTGRNYFNVFQTVDSKLTVCKELRKEVALGALPVPIVDTRNHNQLVRID